MVFAKSWSRGSLARRYMVAALIAALVPLLIISVLYDRYAADLLHRVSASRVEGETEAVAARMSSFLSGQMNRLENIADLLQRLLFCAQALNNRLMTPISTFYYWRPKAPKSMASNCWRMMSTFWPPLLPVQGNAKASR